VITPAVLLLAEQTTTAKACALLGTPRASHYRNRRPVPLVPAQRSPRASPPNALTVAEQDEIIAVLTGPRFCDKSVAQTWATLLDEGVYLASRSTMHRLLRLIGQSGDRRTQATHPARARPELMASKPGRSGGTSSASTCPQPSGRRAGRSTATRQVVCPRQIASRGPLQRPDLHLHVRQRAHVPINCGTRVDPHPASDAPTASTPSSAKSRTTASAACGGTLNPTHSAESGSSLQQGVRAG
jgi:hypothetical protein